MSTDFRITALPTEPFEPFFHMTDEQLAAAGAARMTADKKPGFPCRVSLADAEVGEEVVLLPFAHHEVGSPYRASGPIFVRKQAKMAAPVVNEVPQKLLTRLLSLRGYDRRAMMVGATVVEGAGVATALRQLFADEVVEYVHIHNAKPGCFACRADRA